MNICAVHLVTFSPTHTSKQVGEAIVRGTGVSEIMKTDLTLHPAGKLEIPENTLAVITVPVYGGKVAPLALECAHASYSGSRYRTLQSLWILCGALSGKCHQER